MKDRCRSNTSIRKSTRCICEAARDDARRIATTAEYRQSCRARKKMEILFAHLKRILKLRHLRLRGPTSVHDEFLLV
uniref:transposase n=1 Tax=Paraburkholderia solitsugae TaxID=2675748 RepID=UPI0038B32537